jgi:flagellar protein FliO/FliZ
VLAMVGGAGLLARRFGVPGVTKAASDKRLAIVETLMVGPRQRLFIVRRDNVEHLVLSTPDGASVIESGIITSPSGLRIASAATATSAMRAR